MFARGRQKLAFASANKINVFSPYGYSAVDVHSVTHAISESTSSISIWNIVNQLSKYHYSWGLVANNLKKRQLFSDQMNRNHFDLILARRYWNCSTIENLSCLKFAVNEIV